MEKRSEISGTIYFEEVQSAPRWLPWVMLAPLVISIGLPLALYASGNDEGGEGLVVLFFVVPLQLLIILLMRSTRFEKVITSNGIYFRWLPLQRRYRYIEKDSLLEAYLRNAFALRIGISYLPGRGWIHQTGSGKGLQLRLHGGRQFFLGTGQPEAIEKAVNRLGLSNSKTAAQ